MEKNKYTTGFKVPEGYFGEFESRMLEKLKEEQLPKDSGFIVPEDYFVKVEEKLLQTETSANWKIFRSKQTENKKQNRKSMVYALTGIAAVLAIVLAVYPFGNTNSFTFDEINDTSVSAYIQDGELDLTADDFAIYLQDEDFDALMTSSEQISEESLSDYLLNNIDNNTLLFE